MAKSMWKQMTEEQKQKHRDGERERRALRKAARTPNDSTRLSEQRAIQRKRRIQRDIDHHQEIERSYKRDGKGWFFSWANAIKQRAARKGIPYDIDADYLMSIYTGVCPVFNVPFERRDERTSNAPFAPTVDRIVPSAGYVRGNIIIISRRANNIKSDATPEEMRKVAQYYETLIM